MSRFSSVATPEKSQDHLYRQRATRHVGGDSHVDENRDMTIGIYVENIILHHLEAYKDEINRLAEMKFKELL